MPSSPLPRRHQNNRHHSCCSTSRSSSPADSRHRKTLPLQHNLPRRRERFPFGENQRGYNLQPSSTLDAMFAAHVLVGAKTDDEYRVILIGDSSVWGTLLTPEQNAMGQLNSQNISCNKNVRAYNLGYPAHLTPAKS
ncbi:MAG: hypothetical protein U0X87_16765 [Anaerolineales bacterium]